MEQQLQNDEIEIDLRELFYVLRRKVWVIILCLVLGAGIMAAYTIFLVTPQYSASSMLYVLTKSTSVTSLADIQLGTQLTKDYEILIKSRPVVEQAVGNVGLNYTYEDALELIEITNPNDSRVLNIIVTHPDPATAQKLANEMAIVTADRMADIMATDKPSIAETAVLPEEPVSPSLKKNCAIGGILGAILAMAIIVVIYMLDDTIKSEDDVERYLGLTTLALIPLQEGMEKQERIREKKHAKAKKAKKPQQEKGGN